MRTALALVVLVFLAGCTGEQTATGQVTANVASTPIVEKAAVVQEFEILLKQTIDKDGDIDSEELYPRKLSARQGETVKLVFMLDDSRFVSIEKIGFAEKVQNDIVEFVVKEKGEYSILCMDCENTHDTILRVE